MISHDYKIIFTRVPRTGSGTLRQVMIDNYNAIYPSQLTPSHASLYEYQQLVGHEIFDAYFKFGMVRNPWDRVVSMHRRYKWHQRKKHLKPMKFDVFVEWINYSSDTMQDISPKRYQLDWLRAPDGKMLADWIGRFENIKNDIKFIAKKFGVKLKKIPHVNKMKKKKPYVAFYNNTTRRIIADKFDEDIEYFGYQFGK